MDLSTFSYYIDGEMTPSIQFIPSMLVGAGFNEQTAPWGTKWFGKGAAGGGWFNNLYVLGEKFIELKSVILVEFRFKNPFGSRVNYHQLLVTINSSGLSFGEQKIFPPFSKDFNCHPLLVYFYKRLNNKHLNR